MAKLSSLSNWIRGLIAATIGGAATAVTAMIVSPDVFNFHDLSKLGQMAAGGAFINLCFYLKQSPIPPPEPDTTPTT